jgi:hypothetical protein
VAFYFLLSFMFNIKVQAMNTRNIFRLASVMLTTIVFCSCGTTTMLLDVMKPAEINIPQDIKTIAVVNRSYPEKEQEVNNVVEGLITGEGLMNDRFGSQSCIKGFMDGLASSPRFSVAAPDLSLKGTGTDKFPPLLDWAKVDTLCMMFKADALITLETFDSNVSGRLFALLQKGGNKELTVEVGTGWRIYDPANQRLIDENLFHDSMGWTKTESGDGQSKSDVVRDAGYWAGQRYAARISPLWVSVTRMYYGSGNRDFKIARELVNQGMYDDAAKLWMKYTEGSDRKLAGRACYNMALAWEIKGDLQTALEWAKRSLIDFGNRNAGQYINVLNNRIYEGQRLDEQIKPD